MDDNERALLDPMRQRISVRVIFSVCLITCIVTIGSSIYCTHVLYLIRTEIARENSPHVQPKHALKKSDTVIVAEDGDFEQDMLVEYMGRGAALNREKRATKRHKKCKCPKTMAAHYEQVIRPEYFEIFHIYDDKQERYNDSFGGVIKSNGDFYSTDYPLKIFKLASGWKEKSSPFQPLGSDGKFIAKKSGVHLVYVQVVLFDKSLKQEIKIVHRRKDDILGSYTCVQGLPKGNTQPVKNTCSMTSLFYLNKKDSIRVELEDVNQKLSLEAVNTYFGAILLR